jgi:aflatoxin B1 aldehyde reductase
VKDGVPGSHEALKINLSIKQSLEELKTSSVEVMFLHVPDRQTPFEETAKAMNDAFTQGEFKKFGLSNYSVAEVQKFIDICKQNGYVKPSVYEGHYNPVTRGGEKELLPLLRKHGMAFLAYRYAQLKVLLDSNLKFFIVLQLVAFSQTMGPPLPDGLAM